MKTILILFIIVATSLTSFAYEGVVHGVKTMNGTIEKFDIFIKGDKICVEGTNAQGYFKIIFDRGSDEVVICMDSPYYAEKGYFKVNLSERVAKKQIEVLSTTQKNIEKDGKSIATYSAITSLGAAILEVNPNGNADLSGLSKYMEDPVYELIDHYNIKNTIEKIDVNKPNEKYSIALTATEKVLSEDVFAIPNGYAAFEVKGN